MDKKDILVVGGDSIIAKSLITKLRLRGDVVTKTSRRVDSPDSVFLDLQDVDAFLQGNAQHFDVVVFCAAVTKFEICRDNYSYSYEVNVNGPLKIAEYYSKKNARIVFLSSSAVFDGKTQFENSLKKPNSTNLYGKLKAEAERQLQDLPDRVSILRLSKIIDPEKNIFVNWQSDLKKGENIKAFADQFISPLTIEMAIKALLSVIDDHESGIYQFSADGDISYFAAINELAARNSINKNLISKGFAAESGIPLNEIFSYNSLDSSRVKALLNVNSPGATDFLDCLE